MQMPASTRRFRRLTFRSTTRSRRCGIYSGGKSNRSRGKCHSWSGLATTTCSMTVCMPETHGDSPAFWLRGGERVKLPKVHVVWVGFAHCETDSVALGRCGILHALDDAGGGVRRHRKLLVLVRRGRHSHSIHVIGAQLPPCDVCHSSAADEAACIVNRALSGARYRNLRRQARLTSLLSTIARHNGNGLNRISLVLTRIAETSVLLSCTLQPESSFAYCLTSTPDPCSGWPALRMMLDLAYVSTRHAQVPWVVLTVHRPLYSADAAEFEAHSPGGALQVSRGCCADGICAVRLEPAGLFLRRSFGVWREVHHLKASFR